MFQSYYLTKLLLYWCSFIERDHEIFIVVSHMQHHRDWCIGAYHPSEQILANLGMVLGVSVIFIYLFNFYLESNEACLLQYAMNDWTDEWTKEGTNELTGQMGGESLLYGYVISWRACFKLTQIFNGAFFKFMSCSVVKNNHYTYV